MLNETIVRPYAPGDETGVVATWKSAMWADPITTLQWRTRYLLDPNFDPAHCQVAILEVTGEVVGFLLGMTAPAQSDAWIVAFGVQQPYRRNGIASRLLTALLLSWSGKNIARVQVGPYVPSYVTPGIDEAAYPEAIAFLNAQGAETLSRPLSMKASLTGYRPARDVSIKEQHLVTEGIRVRPLNPSDIVPLLTFLDGHFPHWRPDATSVLHDIYAGNAQVVNMFVAEDNGRIIGYAQSRLERFGPFGVDESYRGRGVGTVLLSTVLLAMRAQGFHSAWFLWTSDRAAKLYREHGFEEVRRFALMALSLQEEQ